MEHTLDVDDVETTVVALTVSDNTNTTHVTTTSGHDDNTGVELDKVNDLASGEIDLDGVVDLDGRVGVTDAIERKLANHVLKKKFLLYPENWNSWNSSSKFFVLGRSTKAWSND